MDIEQLNKKYNTEFTNRLYENRHIFSEIYEVCNFRFWKGCGSYLFDGQTYKYCDFMYEKQELLYNSVKNAKNVLEIGTYMGHSLLIMLLSNPTLKITCIDIDDQYTRPAVNLLNEYFDNAVTFIHCDSLTALHTIQEKFDFFHIDGNHDNEYISNEFKKIITLNDSPTSKLRIIFDDLMCLYQLQHDIHTNYNVINTIVPNCVWTNVYFEIQL